MIMEQKELLCKALKWSAWGYFFLYFNINIGALNLLPAWIGYVLFYNAIKTSISYYESSANLLKPLCFLSKSGCKDSAFL